MDEALSLLALLVLAVLAPKNTNTDAIMRVGGGAAALRFSRAHGAG
jgi:hypothetical protein